MGISGALRARPFYTGGSGSTPLVPDVYPVSLDGRPYMIDTARGDEWRHETVPLLRPQSDGSDQPGEASLNPDGLWRRSWSSFHKGAGQTYGDREGSLPTRFRASRGVNVWERDQLTLLPGVDQKRTSSATNLKLVPAGDRLFLIDGAACVYTTDITAGAPTWADTSGEPGGTILDIASDGESVWITDGANVYDADASVTPPDFTTAWSTQDVDVLGFVKGRLVGWHDGVMYSFGATGTATAVTMTAVRLPTNWTCVGFAGGPTNSVIYVAGWVGDKSLVLRVGIREDGTGLDAAIVAAELPDGEIVRSIGSYLGFVLLGTDDGVRFATPDQSGNLTVGALLETTGAVRCFEGQGPYVWFGWEDYADDLTGADWHGLGRLSLEEFSSADRLAPAYATDLMTEDNGAVSSVVTFQGRRVWCVEGTDLGVYAEEATLCAEGSITFSDTDFGFTGEKIGMYVDTVATVPASDVSLGVTVFVDGDTNPTQTVTGSSVDGINVWGLGGVRGSALRLAVLLTRGATYGPTVLSAALRAVAATDGTRKIRLPLLLNSHVDPDGGIWWMDVTEEREVIEGWWDTRQPLTLKEIDSTFTVSVDDFQWFPRLREADGGGWGADGTMLVVCKEL